MLRFVRSYDIDLHMHLTHLDMVRAMTCRVRSQGKRQTSQPTLPQARR